MSIVLTVIFTFLLNIIIVLRDPSIPPYDTEIKFGSVIARFKGSGSRALGFNLVTEILYRFSSLYYGIHDVSTYLLKCIFVKYFIEGVPSLTG